MNLKPLAMIIIITVTSGSGAALGAWDSGWAAPGREDVPDKQALPSGFHLELGVCLSCSQRLVLGECPWMGACEGPSKGQPARAAIGIRGVRRRRSPT